MNVERYFHLVVSEVDTLKYHVRGLKDSTQWLMDGEWKESILRSVLRRSLPDSIAAGNGICGSRTQSSPPTRHYSLRLISTDPRPRW
jgi:hypothetical protein